MHWLFSHTHTYISYTVNGAQHAVKHVFIILRFWNVEILLHFKCSKISTLQNRKIMMQQKRVLQCVFNSALAYLSGLSWANWIFTGIQFRYFILWKFHACENNTVYRISTWYLKHASTQYQGIPFTSIQWSVNHRYFVTYAKRTRPEWCYQLESETSNIDNN